MMTSMRILAVDTTGAHGSVALLEEGMLRGLVGLAPARPHHAETLLSIVDEMLGRLDLAIEQVDGYAVAVGPGSFTGLRIGIATVEGLAFANGRPAVGVSALDATAYRFRYLEGLVVAIIEAYRGEIYGAAYRSGRSDLTPVGPPVCEPPERFLDALPERPSRVAGTAILRHAGLVTSRWGTSVLADASFFLGEEVARLGAVELEAGRVAKLGGLEALYIRPSDAERNLQEKAAPEE
jgi:tRNA threonylcarbamoyladenosine biosynthesis protein TsaB